MKLNKNARKWVAALRSGKFRQGRGTLAKREDGKHVNYCCLGVACTLFEKEYGVKLRNGVTEYGEIKFNDPKTDCGFNTAALPENVREWLGLRTDEGKYGETPENTGSSLVTQNDEEESSFKEIADIIEKNVDDLFYK